MRLTARFLALCAFAVPCAAQDFGTFDFSLDPANTVEGRYWQIQYAIRKAHSARPDAMPLVYISDPKDPRVADYRAVSEPNLVRVRGVFIASLR